ETYPCKPNDTFATICREKYHAEKYAQALLMFNRSYPTAAEGVRSEPPVLAPGQPVYLPPIEILEKRYPTLIPSSAPGGGGLGSVAPSPAPGPSGTPSTSWASPASERLYTVQEKAETFYEIAKKVFRDDNRWSDISRLNGSFATNAVLPVGTVLRLPAQ